MVFSSNLFLFIFLPSFLLTFYAVYFSKLKNFYLDVVILAFSMLFYFWGEAWFILLMLLSASIDYYCGYKIQENFTNKSLTKKFLLLSILSNLSILILFKYSNFFYENIVIFFSVIDIELSARSETFLRYIWLPMGISYYTFQSMSYTIDVYRGDVKCSKGKVAFLSYVTMFPQLVAGPIVRFRDIYESLENKNISIKHFISGCERFILGLAKKVLIANNVAYIADEIFAIAPGEMNQGLAWLGIICYTLQIYFDFSGYSDMAIGLGRMIGLNFPENFTYPYSATSIREFWQKWHISLSTWFRDYLYIPLGGSRQGNILTYRNLLAVFILCGLWHGSSWNFLIWGLYHGFILVLERFRLYQVLESKLPMAIRNIFMLVLVMIGWVFFRSDDLPQSIQYLSIMFDFSEVGTYWFSAYEFLTIDKVLVIFIGILFSYPILPRLRKSWEMIERKLTRNILQLLYGSFVSSCLVFSILYLARGGYNPFIYFRF